MYLCKFGQNTPIGSEDRAQKRSSAYKDADTLWPFVGRSRYEEHDEGMQD